MRGIYEGRRTKATEIQGQFLSRDDKIVPPQFGNVCRMLWPDKTAAHIAVIAKRDERTAKRWLAGEYEPPIVVVLAVINKMFEASKN